jgi:hypothetical protein
MPVKPFPMKEAYLCINCEHVYNGKESPEMCPRCRSFSVHPIDAWLKNAAIIAKGDIPENGFTYYEIVKPKAGGGVDVLSYITANNLRENAHG